MKMYYFNPNDHGQEYFVMAENKIQAHQFLIKYFEKYSRNFYYNENIQKWIDVDPLDHYTFPDSYTLDEYDVGVVIETELC
jgi:hypothetical protein